MTEAITVFHWSRLSDRIGRKPVLLIGMLGLIISMLCFGLSRTFITLVIRYVVSLACLLAYTASTKLILCVDSRCLCGLLNGNIGKIIFSFRLVRCIDNMPRRGHQKRDGRANRQHQSCRGLRIHASGLGIGIDHGVGSYSMPHRCCTDKSFPAHFWEAH